jgi:hypothetical protein
LSQNKRPDALLVLSGRESSGLGLTRFYCSPL